ncbi:MAG TPA: ABC transporter permease [Gammaproteobacteria bacterium]|nr:ABC transporter permease [Gammaproteobacteria bacterium]
MAMPGWLDVLARDLKFTRRVLTKNFAFTATAIVTLALGIAASTVIYSVVDAVLLKPLDYNDSGDIYRVYTVDTLGLPRGTTGPPHIDPMAADGQSIQAAMYGYSFEQSVVNDEGTAFALNEFRASDEFFQVFTEPLHMGRAFQPGEDWRNTVLSYQMWRDVFNSDPNILGKPIRVGSGPLNVIGVAAQGFEFPVGTGMWTKIFTGPPGRPLPLFNMPGYVRVHPGISAAQVQAELDVFAGRLNESIPWPDGRALEFVAQPLLEEVVGDLRSTLIIVVGATAVLLLIACLNVANLLLARGVVRTSEIALREALGARRWRVFRQLMTESFALCTIGGVLGLGLALGAIQVLKAIGPADLPRFGTLAIDQNVFLFAAACVLLVAFAVGLAPALRVSSGNLSGLINTGGRSAAVAPGRNRVFGVLVIAEIALAVVLVIGAGLLVRSYSQLSSADPGFDPQRMLTVVLNVTGRIDVRNLRPDPTGRFGIYDGSGMLGVAQFYQELVSRIDALPGVASAGAASAAPLNQGLFPVTLNPYPVLGTDTPANDQLAYGNQVSPEFFTTLGIRPLAGRLLEPTDRRGAAGVAVVNETYARTYLAGENPIGRRISAGAGAMRPGGIGFGQLGEQTIAEAEIVGVIPDIKQANLQDGVQPAVYTTHEQTTMRKMAVMVRAETDDVAALIQPIRRELAAMDPTIPATFAIYSDVIAASLARHRLGALVLVVFGLVSLTLAAVGTYGLISFSVNQRFNEIAVRSAFGAERGNLVKMFVMRALQLAGIGVVFGIGGAIALRQVVASQLYETSALDPWVLAAVPLIMLGVTMLASYVPARRASRIDVCAALREN